MIAYDNMHYISALLTAWIVPNSQIILHTYFSPKSYVILDFFAKSYFILNGHRQPHRGIGGAELHYQMSLVISGAILSNFLSK